MITARTRTKWRTIWSGEEVREALEVGYGESSRYSVTLLERALYSAKRLPDGSVLRLSVSQNTLLTLLLGMAQPVLVIFLVAAVLSFLLASRLSKRIVKPLNELNLDAPLENADEGYEELSPLLGRLHRQQEQIKRQSEELTRKKEEFEAVTGNMTEGILLLNAEGRVLSVNRAGRRILFRRQRLYRKASDRALPGSGAERASFEGGKGGAGGKGRPSALRQLSA